MRLLIIMLTLLGVSTLFSQGNGFETDTMACESVSLKLENSIQHYYDSTHSYYNTGLSRIKSNYIVIKNSSNVLGRYRHDFTNAETTRMVYSNTENFIDWNIMAVENIHIAYQENALLVTWSLPDSLILYDSALIAKFHIFYAETDIEHISMLDSALHWNMSYEEAWEWEIGTNMYDYFFVLPKRTFPAYSSIIRIGIVAEHQYIDKYGMPYMSIYSRVCLAPDIVNRSIPAPENILLESSP